MIELDHLNIELSGTNLIEASAGTGKTYAIACLYLRLLIEKEIPPEQILVVTYTEAATKELRGRIRARIGEALRVMEGAECDDAFLSGLREKADKCADGRKKAGDILNRALASFDMAAIFTIHGFCLRALRDNVFESGSLYDTELVTDQTPLLREIVDDFWRMRFFIPSSPLLDYALRQKDRYSRDNFMEFLKKTSNNSSQKIIPRYDADEIADIERKCLEAHGKLREMWRQSSDEIKDIIRSSKSLSRAKDAYHENVVSGLFSDMDAFAEGDNPYNLFADFQKFTPSFLADKTNKNKPTPSHVFFDCCQRMKSIVTERFLALKSELLAFYREEMVRRKRVRNIRSFDDLLNDLCRALYADNGAALSLALRNKYQAALIDEFQDTDPVQYDIFRKIYDATDSPLFLIGDPKQAIYSFRGADIFAYMRAASDVVTGKRFTLRVNRRSDPRLLNAFNAVFSSSTRPFLFDQIRYHPAEPAPHDEKRSFTVAGEEESGLQLWSLPASHDGKPFNVGKANRFISSAAAGEIARLLTKGSYDSILVEGRPLKPCHVAVIVRSHCQATMIQEDLRKQGVPSVMRSDKSVFATDEAHQLLILLRALADPGDERRVRAALATDLMGRNINDINAINEDETAWERCQELFQEHHRMWLDSGFMAMIRSFVSRENIRARLLRFSDGARRLTNLLHCFELIHKNARESGSGVQGTLSNFSEQIARGDSSQEAQIRLETDDDAVTIVTIHASKGLEYPVTFCPFLWGGIRKNEEIAGFHDAYEMIMDYGSADFDEHLVIAQKEELAENLRLAYVALTRARYRCYLCAGKIEDKNKKNRPETSPLSYLFHAPAAVENAPDPVGALAAGVSALNHELMFEQLGDVVARSDGGISLSIMPEEPKVVSPFKETYGIAELVSKKFSRVIAGDWRVASFTSFSAHGAALTELPDRDEVGGDESLEIAAEEWSREPFFPRGARTGVFFHDIFEQYDFTRSDPEYIESLIANQLEKHDFDDAWAPHVFNIIKNVATVPLKSPEGLFSLSDIKTGDWLTELEFFFPLRFITPEALGKCLANSQDMESPVNLKRVCDALKFKPARGMVRGFVDMVFRYGGRYYLVDWKSNFLGPRTRDYDREVLGEAMERNLYPLQYLLYTVALNRYLSLRLKDYDYSVHFGGVLYFFIRGVSAELGEDYGVFRDLPSKDTVDDLTRCLIEAGG